MPVKEQLTQVERDKLEIDPDFDFREIATRPFEELTSNEIGMFKWSGVYAQLQKGFFMIRLRLPGGVMTAEQLRKAGRLAGEYAQGELCITTRQTLQYHWVRQQDIYKIIEGMEAVGVNTRNACGDVTRNVVTCPLAGVCPHEKADTLKVLSAISEDPKLLNEYRNFPRKHKVSVAGCGRACAQTLMNCQGWHPVTRDVDGVEEVGWRFHAGGGLGARPYLAKRIFDWVPEELVQSVSRATAEAFNRHGNRRKRAFARLKIVIDKMGARGFGEVVLDILDEWKIQGVDAIQFADDAADVGPEFLDNRPVIPQRQEGMNTVRVMVPRGEFVATDAQRIADLAETYGDGSIIFTARQNFQFRFVPTANVEPLIERLKQTPWPLEGHERVPDAVACVGTTMCRMAVADTTTVYKAIMTELTRDDAWWQHVGPLRINMNGCPNNCAHSWVADIGLRGLRKREATGSEEGFTVFIGGSLAGEGHIAEMVCDVYSQDVASVIRQMLDVYLAERSGPEETFGNYARTITGAGMRERLERIPSEGQPLNMRNLELKSIIEKSVSNEK